MKTETTVYLIFCLLFLLGGIMGAFKQLVLMNMFYTGSIIFFILHLDIKNQKPSKDK